LQVPRFSCKIKALRYLFWQVNMKPKNYTAFKKMFQEHNGVLRVLDAIKLGIPEYIVYEMQRRGELVREGRGLYRLADSQPLGNPDLVRVSMLIPKSVICLISALYFYEITTQIPYSVYIALPKNVGTPRIEYPPIEVIWVVPSLHSIGVEEHTIDGVKMKIYNREKTIVDCFKFRKKVGDNVALEALKEYVKQPQIDVHLLLEYARINRVEKIILPYLKSLI
jgi:predicted transcriptional regulator of viral defense system